jgi:DNA helicase HerA-like ATPase
MQIRLGKMMGTSQYVTIPDEADNFSILTLGQSGSGKSYAMQEIERNIASIGGTVLVLNYRKTHDISDREEVVWIDVKNDGFPFPLFERIFYPNGTEDTDEDVTEAIVEIFSSIMPLPVRQKSSLRLAVKNIVKQTEIWNDGVIELGRLLQASETEQACCVYEKFSAIFSLKERRNVEITAGKIIVLDFSTYPVKTQQLLAEFTLAVIWRYFQAVGKYAKYPVFISLDEFQALNMSPNATISQILREGRKFNISLLLATQTLASFDKAQRGILMQAATCLYFRPSLGAIKYIFDGMDVKSKRKLLENMKGFRRGDCIAIGQLAVGKLSFQKPVRVTFRN